MLEHVQGDSKEREKTMKALIVSLLISIALAGHVQAQEKEAYKIYDEELNLKGFVRKKAYSEDYEILDRNYERKGHIKRSRLTDRYEVYDQNWKRLRVLDDWNDLQTGCR